MNESYRDEAARLEQQFADAYKAFRKHLETNPYPSTEDEWAEHDRYRDAISQASAAWGRYSDYVDLR